MVGTTRQHAAVLDELVEWWQDLSHEEINSQAVLLPVPPKWGRTDLLNQFAAAVEKDEASGIVVRVPGASLPDGLGLQAEALRGLFSDARFEPSVAELLGVDRLGGAVQFGLGVAGLVPAPLLALAGLLLASVGVGAGIRVWDDRPAGKEGAVARLARAVAALSESVPVVVIIDDADWLELDLTVALVENLVERADGRVLVVAAVNPGENVLSTLTSRATYGLTEDLVQTLNVDPGMGYQARVGLATDLCPQLPAAALRRIGQRTQTFVEVFAVTAAKRLTELNPHDDEAATVTLVDEVINAQVNRAIPSRTAVVAAWAGGVLHTRQAERAAKVLRENRPGDDGDVRWFEFLVRLADPASPRLAEQVRVLTAGERNEMAETVLKTAAEVGADRGAGLVEKVVAWQAAHRVRGDLQNRTLLAGMQCKLVHGLEDLGDPDAAFQVAEAALAEYRASKPGKQQTPEHDDLAAAVLRLARIRQSRDDDAFVDTMVAAVAAGGAAIGLEARIWAAIELLAQPGQRERALQLTDQIGSVLSRRPDLGVIGDRWRLLLAFHVGRAGYPAMTEQLLAPMLGTSSPPEDGDAARAVLYAVDGPGADIRLQIVGLEAELAALPPDADDERLRVHHALAADYDDLGDYHRALHHGQLELPLRRRVEGDDHPDTLNTRADVAGWTALAGDHAKAVRLYQGLLPDQLRILGPDHRNTLRTRSGIALSTWQAGNWAKGRKLYEKLLPDLVRALGRDHPQTLHTRANFADLTGVSGHPAKAQRLFQELMPDQERVYGRDHPQTLIYRNYLASWTGHSGHPAEALRLFQELLPDEERVIGPEHAFTLGTRNNIAFWTKETGRPAEALLMMQELLPTAERILGADHPETLNMRINLAASTEEAGNPAKALQLFQKLLSDLERVLGRNHRNTLIVRNHIQRLRARRPPIGS